MKFVVKFTLLMMLGYTIGRTERPIHEMEINSIGGEGVSDFHLIFRYVVGASALGAMLVLMFADHPIIKEHLDDLGMGYFAGCVGVGGGVGIRFMLNSLEDSKSLPSP